MDGRDPRLAYFWKFDECVLGRYDVKLFEGTFDEILDELT